jgi:hypothetical protein
MIGFLLPLRSFKCSAAEQQEPIKRRVRPYFVMELVHGVKITDYRDAPQNSLTTD